MARIRKKGAGWTVRLRYGESQDSWFDLNVDGSAPDVAEDRRVRLQRMANLLKKAGRAALSRDILTDAALERSEKGFRLIEAGIEAFTPGESEGPQTFRQVAEYFSRGHFQDEYPDAVKKRKDPRSLALSAKRLEAFYPELGPMLFSEIDKGAVERAKRRIPRVGPNTRRAYLQELRRILQIAAEPLGLIPHALAIAIPPKAPRKQFVFLYPENEHQLISSGRPPFARRFLYAYLSRTGRRIAEVLLGTWGHVDLKEGIVRVEASWTKTRVAQFYQLDGDVLEALRLRHASLQPKSEQRVFVSASGRPMNRRSVLRWMISDLKAVELDRARPELLEAGEGEQALRVHDLGRGTFITLARAMGRPDRWIMDRTGHDSVQSLELYDRVTRSARERNLGWLAPMGVALGMRGAVSIGPAWAEGHCYGMGQLWSNEPEKQGISRGKAVTDSVLWERHRTSITEENRQNTDAREGVSPPSEALGPPSTPNVGQSSGPADPGATDPVETALAFAITEATRAGRFDVVLACTNELAARRRLKAAEPGVSDIDAARKKRERNGEKP